jgi:glycine cleavage system H protein
MKFLESHQWVELVNEGIVVMGISNYAQKELGEIVYIELPKIGSLVIKGEEIAVLESTKAATDIYSPVSGKIIAINELLKENPELINLSPEKEGWIIKVELTQPEEYNSLG